MNFNEKQLQAINHYKGSCAVIAGAGSGKSTVLLNRIKNLVEKYEVNEKEILAISFTKNTASELKSKLSKMGLNNINVGTFHSICRRILLSEGYNDVNNLIKEWESENCLKSIDRKINVDEVLSFISYQKSYLKGYDDEFMQFDSQYEEEELRLFYKTYEKFKSDKGLYDFDDFMIKCYEVLKNNPNSYTYDFVLVDEHQDSNLVQNLLLKELCPSENVFCVFDYRQAIYSFRGGNTEYCMNFEEWWSNPTYINLEMNYRSNNNIVNKANGFIKKYYGDYEHYSDSIADKDKNGKILVDTYLERGEESFKIVDKIETMLKEGVNPKEIAVLYRLNSQVSHVENELRKRGIEYDITNDSSFFKRKEISGILSYLRLIENQHDDSAFENIFRMRNYPLTFFSNKIIDKLREHASMNNLSLYESFISMSYPNDWQQKNARLFQDIITRLRLQKDKNVSLINLIDNVVSAFKIVDFINDKYSSNEEIDDRINSIDVLKSFVKGHDLDKFITYVYSSESNKKKKHKDCVKLMTIHASKGLEFDHVFLVGVEDTKFPHSRGDLLEEARLFYVAVTRPKENLYISQIDNDNKFILEYVS